MGVNFIAFYVAMLSVFLQRSCRERNKQFLVIITPAFLAGDREANPLGDAKQFKLLHEGVRAFFCFQCKVFNSDNYPDTGGYVRFKIKSQSGDDYYLIFDDNYLLVMVLSISIT
jgi:hypothetical protein